VLLLFQTYNMLILQMNGVIICLLSAFPPLLSSPARITPQTQQPSPSLPRMDGSIGNLLPSVARVDSFSKKQPPVSTKIRSHVHTPKYQPATCKGNNPSSASKSTSTSFNIARITASHGLWSASPKKGPCRIGIRSFAT
jgi:hypothetical protein